MSLISALFVGHRDKTRETEFKNHQLQQRANESEKLTLDNINKNKVLYRPSLSNFFSQAFDDSGKTFSDHKTIQKNGLKATNFLQTPPPADRPQSIYDIMQHIVSSAAPDNDNTQDLTLSRLLLENNQHHFGNQNVAEIKNFNSAKKIVTPPSLRNLPVPISESMENNALTDDKTPQHLPASTAAVQTLQNQPTRLHQLNEHKKTGPIPYVTKLATDQSINNLDLGTINFDDSRSKQTALTEKRTHQAYLPHDDPQEKHDFFKLSTVPSPLDISAKTVVPELMVPTAQADKKISIDSNRPIIDLEEDSKADNLEPEKDKSFCSTKESDKKDLKILNFETGETYLTPHSKKTLTRTTLKTLDPKTGKQIYLYKDEHNAYWIIKYGHPVFFDKTGKKDKIIYEPIIDSDKRERKRANNHKFLQSTASEKHARFLTSYQMMHETPSLTAKLIKPDGKIETSKHSNSNITARTSFPNGIQRIMYKQEFEFQGVEDIDLIFVDEKEEPVRIGCTFTNSFFKKDDTGKWVATIDENRDSFETINATIVNTKSIFSSPEIDEKKIDKHGLKSPDINKRADELSTQEAFYKTPFHKNKWNSLEQASIKTIDGQLVQKTDLQYKYVHTNRGTTLHESHDVYVDSNNKYYLLDDNNTLLPVSLNRSNHAYRKKQTPLVVKNRSSNDENESTEFDLDDCTLLENDENHCSRTNLNLFETFFHECSSHIKAGDKKENSSTPKMDGKKLQPTNLKISYVHPIDNLSKEDVFDVYIDGHNKYYTFDHDENTFIPVPLMRLNNNNNKYGLMTRLVVKGKSSNNFESDDKENSGVNGQQRHSHHPKPDKQDKKRALILQENRAFNC